MGIDYTSYLMIGAVKKDFTDEDYELVEQFEYDESIIEVITDGMSGKYMVIGHVVSSADMYCDTFDELSIEDMQLKIKEVELLLKDFKMQGLSKIKLINFMHVS